MTRRLFYALVLAFVLPLAQLGAAAHEVSHLRGSVPDKVAPAAHCDVCVAVAALTGGGATATAPVLAHAPAAHPAVTWSATPADSAESPASFLSRAPPSLR